MDKQDKNQPERKLHILPRGVYAASAQQGNITPRPAEPLQEPSLQIPQIAQEPQPPQDPQNPSNNTFPSFPRRLLANISNRIKKVQPKIRRVLQVIYIRTRPLTAKTKPLTAKIGKLVAKTKPFWNKAGKLVSKIDLTRPIHATVAIVIFISMFVPLFQLIPPFFLAKRYEVSAQASEIVGKVNEDLSKKITEDTEKEAYVFNKDVMGDEVQTKDGGPSLQVGGGAKDKAEYAVQLNKDSKKGVKIYDSESKESITLIPQFTTLAPKQKDGRVIYPVGKYDAQKIYSVKKNGLKEDIILPSPVKGEVSFSYKLDIPKYLEARLEGSGAIGIYSADQTLFGNISYGSDQDQASVQKARENGKKDHLLFMLPAPVIIESGNKASNPGGSTASFELKDNVITVKANHLEKLNYPISLDPSVIVTSNTNFQYGGNQEGNIDFDSSNNQIKQGALTGGTVPSWTGTTALTVGLSGHAAVAYNGYMYVLGGSNSITTYYNNVRYSPIASNGTLGAWTATTSFTTARLGLAAEVYNGYIYIIGGYGGSYYNDVQYAKINSNGSIGTWTATTSFSIARTGHSSAVYNGYIYMLGGWDSSCCYGDVQYANIKSDGTLGSWVSTTSMSSRSEFDAIAYNGYMYIIGGQCGFLCNRRNDVQYAPINSNGSIGTWIATTSFSIARGRHSSFVNNGYLYIAGGSSNVSSTNCKNGGTSVFCNDVQYAPINSDGSVGEWKNTAYFTNARNDSVSLAYNGYFYILGGYWGGTSQADTHYAAVNPAGVIGTWGTTSTLGTAVRQACSVAYGGYLYALGGYSDSGGGNINLTQYAQITSNGTLGTWSTTTAFTTARHAASCAAYNGYLYILGGSDCFTSVYSDTQYSAIASNGTVGTWTTAANTFTTARRNATAAVYNGYIYIMGGNTTACGTTYTNTLYYSQLGSNGAPGVWSSGNAFTTARATMGSVVYKGYLYLLGGYDNSTYKSDVQYVNISSGAPGTWATTSSFTTARQYLAVGVSNSYMYISGGDNGANLSTSQYAIVNSDGTLGSWTSTTSLGTATTEQGSANTAVNGYFYTVGGNTGGGAITTVNYAQLNNGGPGNTSSWTASTTFTTARSDLGSVAYNGYIYMIGGYDGTSWYSDVQYAPINSNGTLGSWSSTSSMANARRWFGIAVYNGYIYVVGGNDSGGQLSSAEYVNINANGTLGSWSAATSLPASKQRGRSVAYNGYLYFLGGDSSLIVRYSPIASNGSIGSWSSTNSLQTNHRSFGAIAYNGYMYAMGGHDGAADNNTVEYAAINSDGTVGAWAYTTNFDVPRNQFGVVAINGYLHIYGGALFGAGTLDSTQVAPINSNGTIGNWQGTAPLSVKRKQFGYATYNGYFYMIGGDDNVSRLNTTSYTAQFAQPRIGQYSRLIDITGAANVDVNPTKIVARGTNTGNPGTGNVALPTGPTLQYYGVGGITTQYKFGTTGCTTFSTAQNLSTSILSQLQTPFTLTYTTDGCATATALARQIWIRYILDDSQTATFPDSAGNRSTITDFEIYYHAASTRRLRGGQTFTNEIRQSLDTTPN